MPPAYVIFPSLHFHTLSLMHVASESFDIPLQKQILAFRNRHAIFPKVKSTGHRGYRPWQRPGRVDGFGCYWPCQTRMESETGPLTRRKYSLWSAIRLEKEEAVNGSAVGAHMV